MKKSTLKFVAPNGNTLVAWQRNLKPGPDGEKRPWFHVSASANGKVGMHSFGTKKEMLGFFQEAKKNCAANNFTISDKAVENFHLYAQWKRSKGPVAVKKVF
jgi:hypothetical protein